MEKGRVLLGLSGGVDSSVAALLLKKQGYEVEALFMRNWEDDDGSPYCSIKEDFMDAVFVSNQLDIKLTEKNFSKDYRNKVFKYFLKELNEGRTPNPDILCNKEIKFNSFYEYAMNRGFDFISTGHYVRNTHEKGKVYLKKGSDYLKDQSYFLHSISNESISKSLFPLGIITKKEVRDIARKEKLITSNKKDSTGICFIGERPFPDFLERYIPKNPGPIFDENLKEIGKHVGLPFYTLGQRQGLGIGGIKNSKNTPWYVVNKDLKNNSLTVVQGNDHPLLMSKKLTAKNLSLINPLSEKEFFCKTKIRYRQEDQDCFIKILDNNIEVNFSEPQRAITPGQSIVLYDEDVCLGGAEISSISYGDL